MLGLRGKSTQWLFYTLLISWLLGRTECTKHSLGCKKKGGGGLLEGSASSGNQ